MLWSSECLPECVICSDVNRLMQVMNNLITNAIKFTTKGSIRVGYRFGELVRIFYVSDTGCGIPADKLKEVFGRICEINCFQQGTGFDSICGKYRDPVRGTDWGNVRSGARINLLVYFV
ncbi:MAG: ATP-binding protein [Butyricimonas faecihominis]